MFSAHYSKDNKKTEPKKSGGSRVRAESRESPLWRQFATSREMFPGVARKKNGGNDSAAFETDIPRSLQSTGQALPDSERRYFEPRFGADFSQVRIHTGEQANTDARALGAKAFTFGNDIVFSDKGYQPNSATGRALLAHELEHVNQQKNECGKRVQRFATCESQEQCPPRDDGEIDASRTAPMIVAGTEEPSGLIVANFGVGRSRVKADLATNSIFASYPRQMAMRPQARFEILGFSDCEGSEARNSSLRRGRATSLHEALPVEARGQVQRTGPAPLGNCIQSNRTARGRSLNRSALLYQTAEVYDFEDEQITASPSALFGVTSPASEFFVRASPNGERVGMLALREMRVDVIGESGTRAGELWYRVRFTPADFEIVRQTYATYMAPRLSQLEALEQQRRESAEYRRQMESRPGMRFETRPQISQASGRIGELTEEINHIRQHQARLNNPYQGTTAWVGEGALSQVAMLWDSFLDLIDAFDRAHANEPLRDRLTRLRQIGEEPELEGDQIVGRGSGLSGRRLRSERAVDTSRWQLLLEAKQVIMPNQEVVDIHHFILGLDALALPESAKSSNRRVSRYWGIAGVRVGESYSAATWSGDVGGAAGDYVMHNSSSWERANTNEDNQQRLLFYFQTRAPEMDLLADIDAWGAYTSLPTTSTASSQFTSLRQVFEAQYGGAGQTAAQYEQTVASGRRAGIENFLRHYGFQSPRNLNSQADAAGRVKNQVFVFSRAWYDVRQSTGTRVFGHTPGTDIRLRVASHLMGTLFLNWLENQAQRYGVNSI